MEPDEKEKIKQSFLKVKEDIEILKTQLNEVKSLIKTLEKNLISEKQLDQKPLTTKEVPQEISSTGNQGVARVKKIFKYKLLTSVSYGRGVGNIL